MKKNYRFLVEAGGIFLSFFFFGILHEKVTRGKYRQEVKNEQDEVTQITETFAFSLTLSFILCSINYVVSKVTLQIWPQDEDKTLKLHYVSVAITYLVGMVCSNMALQWVPYPTQVVGKAAKPIPVLLLGVLIGGKSYALKKYVFITLIVAGLVLFMFKDEGHTHQQEFSFGLGELLLLFSLIMDGLMGAAQDRIRAKSRLSGQQMMKTSNAYSALILALAVVVTGELFKFISFAKRYPYVIPNLLALGVTLSVGQMFIFSMVSDFGPLVVSVVTTTRKSFTVLGSVLIFGNALSSRQWIGAVIVFSGLFLDAFFAKSASKKPINNKSQSATVMALSPPYFTHSTNDFSCKVWC